MYTCPPRPWRTARALLPALALVSVCACNHVALPRPTNARPVLPADADGIGVGREVYFDGGRRQVRFVVDTHSLRIEVANFCDALGWMITCRKPEFTDDQGLMGDTPTEYGPHAKIAPSPKLAEYDEDGDFATGSSAKLVAFVWVDAGPLPSTYTDLLLVNGFTCVYLRHSGEFNAFVTPAATGTCPAEMTPDPATALRVVVANPPSGNAGDLPPVTRFHEGSGDRRIGVPQLGLRCGKRWCIILPRGAVVRPMRAPYLKDNTEQRTWSTYGWGDTQTLADTVEDKLTRGELLGSIIPETSLEAHSAAGFAPDEFIKVATVKFWTSPSKKYKDDWHFRRGNNGVYLKRTSSGDMVGEIRNTTKLLWIIPVWRHSYEVPITQYKHLHKPPATARFLWSKYDEDLWVACEFGCCKIASGVR